MFPFLNWQIVDIFRYLGVTAGWKKIYKLLFRSVITCTYPFTADDDHFQKSTIQSPVICHYTGHQDMTSTQVSPIMSEKIDQEIIWNFCVIRLLYQGPFFYLLYWDPSHLEVTSFKLPSDFGTFYHNLQVIWTEVTLHYLKSLGNHAWDLEVI